MTATETTAFDSAKSEGLSFFWAHMHAGHTVKFVGHSWEDGGFNVNAEWEPRSDSRGNTVAKFKVEDLDAKNKEHVNQCEEWYNG